MGTENTRRAWYIGIAIAILAALVITILGLIERPRAKEYVYGTAVVSAAEPQELGTATAMGHNLAE